MSRAIAHVLAILAVEERCDCGCPPEAPCDTDVEIKYTITCPYMGQRDAPGRDCTTWTECGCKLNDDERDLLYRNGSGQCPHAPDGKHHCVPGLDFVSAYALRHCWADWCDLTPEAVEGVHHDHGEGGFLVTVASSQESIEFDVLARLENVKEVALCP